MMMIMMNQLITIGLEEIHEHLMSSHCVEDALNWENLVGNIISYIANALSPCFCSKHDQYCMLACCVTFIVIIIVWQLYVYIIAP